jgi:ubiquinone/menaquinone biosynthesis C-methylase UbiE
LIEYVRQRGIPPNVALLHCSEYSIPLPDRSADFALLAFVLHENAEKDRFLNEIFRVLAPGGRMLILEWKRQVEEHGPPPGERLGETELDHLLSRFMLLEGGSLNSSHYYRLIQKRPSAPSPERAAEGARARDQNPNPTPTDVSKSE